MNFKEILSDQYKKLTPENLTLFQNHFRNEGAVKFPSFIASSSFSFFLDETSSLFYRAGKRRDLIMKQTENTERHMTTVNAVDIKSLSPILYDLYYDQSLMQFLTSITGEAVLPAPDELENITCKLLSDVGDVHGGHIDTYPFTLTIALESPQPDIGGIVEYVTNSSSVSELDSSKVKQIVLKAGDAYLLRSDLNVHRVTGLKEKSRRMVMNLAYADQKTQNAKSYSSEDLHSI